MSRPLAIRTQLTIALVLMAIVASVTSMMFANGSLDNELRSAARKRMQQDAHHGAAMAALDWGSGPQPAMSAAAEVARFAGDHRLRVVLGLSGSQARVVPRVDGRVVESTARTTGAIATVAVRVNGRRVATLYAWPDGAMLDAGELAVADAMDRQHAIATGVSVLVSVLLALLLAQRLAAPLSRLARAADRIGEGDRSSAVIPRAGSREARSISDALERLGASLEQEDRLRRMGFANLAHELRTPVTNIRARLEAAQDDVLPLESGIESMHAETIRLSSLLDQLSMLADAERPAAFVQLHVVDLGALVERQVELHRAPIAAAGVELDAKVDAPVLVRGDELQLAQVVRNLLTNAAAYTDRDGVITVRLDIDHGMAILVVRDTGIGIPAEELAHVTRRFWRGAQARSRGGHGAGIGMAIVDEVVRLHGGTMQIESSEGQGTSVTVRIAVAAEAGNLPGAVSPPV